mgnify:CR=1 FL=1
MSQNAKRSVCCSAASAANVALMELFRGSLPAHLRDFALARCNLIRCSDPQLHRDAASIGESLTIFLGPFVGGLLWQATLQRPDDFVDHVAFYPPWHGLWSTGLSYTAARPTMDSAAL